jgi:hypothetical protein
VNCRACYHIPSVLAVIALPGESFNGSTIWKAYHSEVTRPEAFHKIVNLINGHLIPGYLNLCRELVFRSCTVTGYLAF